MGSSAKKKNDKKKDFKKPKLKVGKARPKPTNFTDTSFKAKPIVLAHQSLNITAPTLSDQFSHHLSLLSSRSSTQRRDSLAYLLTTITSRPVNAPLPQPVGILLTKLNPLVLDGSNGVRVQLLKLFRALPAQEIDRHIHKILLYIRAGLTHLAADIRSSAIDILLWALGICPIELVSCAGGWVKTMNCLLTVLHWHGATPATIKGARVGPSSWSSTAAPTMGKEGSEGKLLVKLLNVLAMFLRAGLVEGSGIGEQDAGVERWPFPLRYVEAHMLPKRSNAFAHLNLFGPPRDEDGDMYVELEERQRVFYKRYQATILSRAEDMKREGGEVGRAAAGVGKAVAVRMEGFDA